MTASTGERAFDEVRSLLASAPPLKRTMFAVDANIIRPWTRKPRVPEDPYPNVDTSDTVLTPDGLMWSETASDFVWTDETSPCGRRLVSRTVAENMGIAEPKRDAEGNVITARPEIRTFASPSRSNSTIPCKRPRSPEPVQEPQAGGSAVAAAAELETNESAGQADILSQPEVADLAYLRHRIDPDDLPEVLLVRAKWSKSNDQYHFVDDDDDEDLADHGGEDPRAHTMIYMRVLPPPRSFDENDGKTAPKLGFACMEGRSPIGVGHSGAVWRCTFAPDASSEGRTCFKTVAKVETLETGWYGRRRVQEFMSNEANVYYAMPSWMSDEYTGCAIVPPLETPQPVSAIVPRFYGLYSRAGGSGETLERVLKRGDPKATEGVGSSTALGDENATLDSSTSTAKHTDVQKTNIDFQTAGDNGPDAQHSTVPCIHGLSDSDAKIGSEPSVNAPAGEQQSTMMTSEGDCQQTAGIGEDQQQGAQSIEDSRTGQQTKEDSGPTTKASPLWSVSKLSQPILLMEDCGEPIDPSALSKDEREQIYGLMLRLHRAGFMQNSMYERNILQRTEEVAGGDGEKARKRFRIVDFGRGELVRPDSRFTTAHNERDARSTLRLKM